LRKKGSELIVEGEISYRDYTDKDGVKKYFTEIICNSLEFCGKKESAPLENKEGQFQKSGKVQTGAMSDVNELPGANDDSLPF
jgi:single-stranded DNA-binding protein